MSKKEEQIKKLWERCGFSLTSEGFPDLTPDNLVQYVLPKLCRKYIELEIHADYLVRSDSWNVALLDGYYDSDESKYCIAVSSGKDFPTALSLAMMKALKRGD